MPQIILEIEPSMARALERVAPAKTRQRSRFIRLAIQKALMELEDLRTADAYRKQPDALVEQDPHVWGEWKPKRMARKKR